MANLTHTIELHYEERGQGLPVILIHGFPFDHRIWSAQLETLSDAYRVIAPDLRGHGQSQAPEGDYGMETLAADVLALLDRLGVDRAVWAGHSMGGYVTMAALRQAPDRFSGVAFVATHPNADSDDKRLQRNQSAEVIAQEGIANVAFSMMGTLFSSHVEGSSEMAQRVYDIMLNTSPVGMAGALRGMANRPASTDLVANLSVPALIIAGTEDKIISREVIEAMANSVPGSSVVWVEGVGHLPMIEKPGATTAALRQFLQKL
jgi:pimeloyl-ACP methyl ester carboxylesterase